MRDVLGVANLRKALASRYFFDNWFILLIKYMMTRLGFDVKLIARVDDCVIEVSPEVFGRLISRFYRGLIRPFKCVNGKLYINDIRIPFDRIDRVDDIQALSSGWFYDISCKYWKKNNVKFKRIYYSMFEIFECGDYDALNADGRDVVDVGAFVGDSAIYFALKGAKRVIAIEPHPGAYAEMLENIRLNNLEGVIVPLNAGLASKPGKILLSALMKKRPQEHFIGLARLVRSMRSRWARSWKGIVSVRVRFSRWIARAASTT
jgi:glycosyltransferase involved in cell wall biosynthesis